MGMRVSGEHTREVEASREQWLRDEAIGLGLHCEWSARSSSGGHQEAGWG